MIVREDKENLIKCMDALQGVYDECIIAVDSRPESDEVFEAIQIYPHHVTYRQPWPGRFDLARQEVLDRVNPKATYIGHCDSDERLTIPKTGRELREMLYNEQPRAVNIGIRYQEQVGPHEPGRVYLRTKIWKNDHVRKYIGAVHEYPACRGETVIPTPYHNRIEFLHLKIDHKYYRSDLIIQTMLRDIECGHIRWLPYLAEEYRYNRKYDEALGCCKKYLLLEIKDSEHPQHLKKCLEEMLAVLFFKHDSVETAKWESFKVELERVNCEVNFLRDNPIFWEYYAMSLWYTSDKDVARLFHERAKSLDPEKRDLFIWQNDQFY